MNNATIMNAFNSDNSNIASINLIQDEGLTKK